MQHLIRLIGGLTAACLALAAASVQAQQPGQAVYTNKTHFRIPYRYDAAEMQSLNAREVQLYVSYDRGAQWRLAQRVAPQQGRFEYEATVDGEYWFAVRTIDNQNQFHPAGEIVEPGLKVVIDSVRPNIEIALKQVEPGKVELTWNASDANLDVERTRLEYIQGTSNVWQPLNVIPQASGRTYWTVPEGGYVAIRGTAVDLAKNVAQSEAQVEVAPAHRAGQEESDPELSRPIASQPQPFPRANLPQQSLIADEPAGRPEAFRGRYPQQTPAQQNATPNATPPIDAQARIVNSLQFQLGYQVDDVGPSGVGSVDLYITENRGRKWYKYGADSDRKSPFDIEVPKDGIYGFAIRVRSGVGLAADPPQPGEQPSVVIVVDKTPPAAALLPVQYLRNSEGSRILLRWQVSDTNLPAKPVALYYALNPQGPWEPLTGWIDNTGNYALATTPSMPPQFYLRLAARDAAGNVQHVQLDAPVIADTSRPSARIVDVETRGEPR